MKSILIKSSLNKISPVRIVVFLCPLFLKRFYMISCNESTDNKFLDSVTVWANSTIHGFEISYDKLGMQVYEQKIC